MADQKAVVGIDIGGTKTLIGLVDRTGEVLVKQQFPTMITDSPEIHIQKCIETVHICLAKAGLTHHSLLGIGVNVPGLADPEKGILLHAPYAGWKNVPVKELLEREWPGMPINIANDVNACALGELIFGIGKQYNSFLWVTISTGIGGGLIIDRQIYEGEHFIAGEVGHLVVQWEEGNLCGCGNRGCLEAHASGTAIAKAAKEKLAALPKDSPFSTYFIERKKDITAQSVAEAAYKGIEEAKEIYQQAGEYIGRAFSYAINIMNPGAIIMGGGVSLSIDLLEPYIRQTFQTAVISEANKNMPILLTDLGYEAALIGAASLIYADIYIGPIKEMNR
ncbi:ROK family protein [Lederbergia citrea]|uniref:ROK family protein n=1 Tax=Lederbergia citrea TaxID=2833581 RepID=A0A942Z2V9_9BACI|nr:ROK family protein [Lederbergia citrea]MBS4222943.1 ROK family protein [Lederbergia citrea]